MSKIGDAFAELCAVCRPRPGQDESELEAAARRLFKVLGEFAEPIAFAALDTWPRRSEWFPTEFELRELLNEIAAEAARAAAAAGRAEDGVYRGAVGKTAYFVDRVRANMGELYVRSWLAGGVNCLFGADTVYTTGIGMQRLVHDCFAQMQEAGVQIKTSERAREMLRKYCDDRELQFEPKRGRK